MPVGALSIPGDLGREGRRIPAGGVWRLGDWEVEVGRGPIGTILRGRLIQ
jgi:hypothetical protein